MFFVKTDWKSVTKSTQLITTTNQALFSILHWEVTCKAPTIKTMLWTTELISICLYYHLREPAYQLGCCGLRVWLGVESTSHLARSSLLSASAVTQGLHQISHLIINWFIFPVQRRSGRTLNYIVWMHVSPSVHYKHNLIYIVHVQSCSAVVHRFFQCSPQAKFKAWHACRRAYFGWSLWPHQSTGIIPYSHIKGNSVVEACWADMP